MSTNERDTKFAGFAKLLLQELLDDMLDEYGFVDRSHYEGGELANAEEIIAQRAYDLAYHTMVNVTQGMAAENEHRPDLARNMRYIPDLTQWPETPSSE